MPELTRFVRVRDGPDDKGKPGQSQFGPVGRTDLDIGSFEVTLGNRWQFSRPLTKKKHPGETSRALQVANFFAGGGLGCRTDRHVRHVNNKRICIKTAASQVARDYAEH